MKKKQAFFLSVVIALVSCFSVFGADAEYMGEIKEENAVRDISYDGTYLSVLSKGEGIYGRYLRVCDYTVSPCSYACDYEIGVSGESAECFDFEVKKAGLKNTVVRDSNGHNSLLSFGRPYYSHGDFLEETPFYTANIKGAFHCNGKGTGYYVLENDNSYGFYYINYISNHPNCTFIARYVPQYGETVCYACDSSNGIVILTESADKKIITPYALTDNEWVPKEVLNKDNPFTSTGIDDMYDKIVLCGADCSSYSDAIYYDINKNKWVDCGYQIEHSYNSVIKTAVWKNEVFAAVCENDNSEMKIYKMELQSEMKGDVDRNGVLTADDAAKALACTLLCEMSDLDDQQKELADMDGNGIITANDAALILSVSLYGK